MYLSYPLEICIGFLNVLNIKMHKWNKISEEEILAQRFSITLKSSSSFVWRENMTPDNYLNVLSDIFSLSLSLSLSFSILLFTLNDYCLGISCLHISYIFTGILASFLFGGIYAVHFNLKGMQSYIKPQSKTTIR